MDKVSSPSPDASPKRRPRKGGLSDSKVSLYAKHIKIYPERVRGTFRTLKWGVVTVLLGLYYLIPWVRWDRGPGAVDQAVLVDMPGRRLYFFWIEIWPQEIYYLAGVLILGAIGLFLVTALAGRVWCGYTCPQTVWTDLFLFVERLIEGSRNKRMKMDEGPLGVEKVLRKIAKHAVWLMISAATGGAWIFYYVDAPSATVDILTGQASTTIYGFIGLFSATTYLLAGWAREQVCIYMCPWPRFQGAMFDEDSLIVTYETWRGEPRGKAKKGDSFDARGHCIDCELCRHVCPTGVDIRDGQQMGCIGCGLCIDACNEVMDRMDLPRGLVTYDSMSNQIVREQGQQQRMRLIRPRTMIYGFILLVAAGIMVFSLTTRNTVEVNTQRDRSPLFVTLSDGSIRNGYTLKILNMIRENRTFTLSFHGLEGADINVIGYGTGWAEAVRLPVSADMVGTFRVFIRMPSANLKSRSVDMKFYLREDATHELTIQDSLFYGPER